MTRIPLFVLVGVCLAALAHGRMSAAAERIALEVREPTGIRRFGYPVEVRLSLPRPISDPTQLKLLQGADEIPAQFSPADPADSRQWWLDTSLSLLPYETRALVVEYGPDVKRESTDGGLAIDTRDQAFDIRHGGLLAWRIRRDLAGFLDSVQYSGVEQLRPGVGGLALVHRRGEVLRLDAGSGKVLLADEFGEPAHRAPVRAKLESAVLRAGPLAVALKFHFQAPGYDHRANDWFGVQGSLILTFVSTKSWVQAELSIDDPQNVVVAAGSAIELDLHRDVAAEPSVRQPALADFGAGSQVYLNLGTDDAARLEASPASAADAASWRVLRGAQGRLEPFVGFDPRLAQSSAGSRCEGWAHLMDSKKCLAAAVESFGVAAADSLEVSGLGRFQIQRRFIGATSGAPRRLQFWLHFVTNPPHVSAATSPQSMQSPLQVRVLDRTDGSDSE